MSSPKNATPWSALLGGFVAVALFSLTIPLMRLAGRDFDATCIGVGRMLLSAGPSAIVLSVIGWPRLSWSQVSRLLLVTGCLVFGFAWLTATALKSVPSHHAAIVTGGIPLATALVATWRGGQHPGWAFWFAAALGSLLVAGYGVAKSGGVITAADLLLLTAAALCGLGYAEGARLASELGSLRLICLLPLLATPGALLLCWGRWPAAWSDVHALSWLAFLYNGLVSAFGAFFFWYPALRRGGAARVGQVQLLQPFLTVAASALLLAEKVAPGDWAVAVAVVACVAAAQRARPAPPALVSAPAVAQS